MKCPKCNSKNVLYNQSVSIAYVYKVSKHGRLYNKTKTGMDSVSYYSCADCGFIGSDITIEKLWNEDTK